MALTVLTNLPAVTARHFITRGQRRAHAAMERIASGRRINKAGDDAAGLAMANSISGRIKSVQQAQRNAQDGLSLIQVATGGVDEISNMLTRLRELAIQSATDTVGDPERQMLNREAEIIQEEVDRLAGSTKYLGTYLLNGQGRDFTFHIGADADESARVQYSASTVDLRAGTLGVDDVDLSDKDSALDSLQSIDEATRKLYMPQAEVGAMQSRMQSAISNLEIYEENLIAARSRILDADLARETAELVQGQIMEKASVAILGQANLIPKLALRLIER